MLQNSVCIECNQFFGDNLEVRIARGSLEALRRIEEGVSPADNAKHYSKERIALKLSTRDHLNGMHVWFAGPGIEPMAQARFESRNRGEFRYIKLAALKRSDFSLPDDADTAKIALLANNLETKQELIEALTKRDLQFEEVYEEGISARGGDMPLVEITTAIDDLLFRTIAKMAFNYLSYLAGAEFALHSQFDEIRDYVRHGSLITQPLVSVSQKPILYTDTENMRQTNGHLIVVDWDYRSHVIGAKVSLFNTATYQVVLTKNASGLIFRTIRAGHHYNLVSGKVEKLASWKKY